MTHLVTLFAALAAITPLAQAVPMVQAMADAQQQQQQQNCPAALILAQGINNNIEDQKNEKAALAQVDQVLQKTPVDANAFAAAKANLLTFVNNGIAIRQANQAITPPGNKATAGLAIVANAQLEELSLTESLTGDPAKDADTIKKLNSDFDGGIKQNQQNMMDAASGCGQANAGQLVNGGAMTNGTQNANKGDKNGDKNANKGDKNGDKNDKGNKGANKDSDAAAAKAAYRV